MRLPQFHIRHPLIQPFWGIILVASGTLLFFTPRISAYVAVGKSLEWLCTFTPVILQAEVIEVTDLKQDKKFDFESANLTCKPEKIFKGKAGKNITFKFMGYGPAGQVGTKYLLFLDRDEEGKWEVVYWINLDNPCKRSGRGTAYTKDGRILMRGGDILKLVDDRLKRMLLSHRSTERIKGMANSLMIDAPGEAELALYAGSTTFLLVPPDPEFRAEFLKRYKQASKAKVGFSDMIQLGTYLCALSYYPDDEVLGLIKKALKDPRFQTIQLHQKPEINFQAQLIKVYGVRQFAYEVLRAAGHKVEEPEHFCRYFYASVDGVGWGWAFRDPATKRTLDWAEVKR